MKNSFRLGALWALACCAASWGQVSHRHAQSPVKDQGMRGTCAAFAICGALETFPGVPTDLSEQLLYAIVKRHQSVVVEWMRRLGQQASLNEGDYFSVYPPLFDLVGTCHESHLPYSPDPVAIPAGVPEELRRFLELAQITPADLERVRDFYGKYGFNGRDCTILELDAARDVDRIKRLLDDGMLAIPAGYSIHGPNWSNLATKGNFDARGTRDIIHPGMMHTFARAGGPWMTYNEAKVACMATGEDLVDGVRARTWVRQGLNPADGSEVYGGHAVLIVGYDDLGFIIKNSWGEGWGDKGYARVNFDYHRLYALQVMLIDEARIAPPALDVFGTRARIERGEYRVKVQPRGGQGSDDPRWVISTWMLDGRDAAWEIAEYTVEGRDADGAWRTLLKETVHAGERESRRGAPVVLRGDALTAAQKSRRVRITARYADLPLGDPTRPAEFRYLVNARFAEFAPSLTSAIDLTPVR
jgi:hypothetical protein